MLTGTPVALARAHNFSGLDIDGPRQDTGALTRGHGTAVKVAEGAFLFSLGQITVLPRFHNTLAVGQDATVFIQPDDEFVDLAVVVRLDKDVFGPDHDALRVEPLDDRLHDGVLRSIRVLAVLAGAQLAVGLQGFAHTFGFQKPLAGKVTFLRVLFQISCAVSSRAHPITVDINQLTAADQSLRPGKVSRPQNHRDGKEKKSIHKEILST